MKGMVWKVGTNAQPITGRSRTLFLIVSLALFPVLISSSASAQLAAGPQADGMNHDLLTPGIARVLRGLPFIDSCDQYIHGSVFTFYVGKLHSMARHFRYELQSTDSTPGRVRHSNYVSSQYGVWLGVTGKIPLKDRFGLNVEGWKLVPIPGDIYGTYVHNNDPPRPGDLPDAMDTWRRWTPGTDGWYVDLHLTFSPGGESYINGIGVVLGGRYDSYYRVLHQAQVRGRVIGLDGDDMEMASTMFIPYIGIQVSRDAPRYDLGVRMIGTPMVIGGIRHAETWGVTGVRDEGWFQFDVPRGYWAELFVDAGLRVTNQVTVGGFLKMTTLTLMSNGDIERKAIAGGASQSDNYDLIFRRIMYTYGAKFALHF
jgi:hypothetical protein